MIETNFRETIIRLIGTILEYLKYYFISALFFGYLIVSVLIKLWVNIDITISCPIKSMIGHDCYGCGLTRATVYLLQFNFEAAFHANPLVYVVLPSLAFLISKHFICFYNVRNMKG